MLSSLLSLYRPSYVSAIVALLKDSHFKPGSYIKLLHKTKNFHKQTAHGRTSFSKKQKLLVKLVWLGIMVEALVGVAVIILGITHHLPGGIYFGLAIIFAYPLLWAYLLPLLVYCYEWFKTGKL